MKYQDAINAARDGKLIAREGWGFFLFMRPGDRIKAETIPVIKSLPADFKTWVAKNTSGDIEFSANLCSFNGKIVINGWIGTSEDVSAKDCKIVEA